MAMRCTIESRPPPWLPMLGPSASATRPKMSSTKAASSAVRTPQRSASPPKKNIEPVMPAVRTPTIQPATWSPRPTYWLKYIAR